MSIDDAIKEQVKMEKLLESLKGYNGTNKEEENKKYEVVKNVDKFFNTRNKIIKAFQDGTFPLAKNVQKKKQIKEVNLDWMHRPNDELRGVMEKIKSKSGLETSIDGKKLH